MATDTALNAVESANAIVYIPPEGISADQSITDDFIHRTVDDNGFSGVGSNPYTAEEGAAKFLAPVTISPLIVHPYWTVNGSNFVGAEDEIFSFDGSLFIDPGTFSDSEIIEISVSSSSGNCSFSADPNGVDLLSDSLGQSLVLIPSSNYNGDVTIDFTINLYPETLSNDTYSSSFILYVPFSSVSFSSSTPLRMAAMSTIRR
jgi:hypothetical protein